MINEIERLREENLSLKNDNKLNYVSIQKENTILKAELQSKYKEIVDLKRQLGQVKAKEFVEKKLVSENHKLRRDMKGKQEEIEGLREYILRLGEVSA
jgi:hypothetical protein